MDATEKAKWTEEAAADKERFAKENAAYLAKKQPESLKAADNVNPGEARETANKVEDEDASGSDMGASHMFETMEAALVQSEATKENVREVDVFEKKVVKARARVANVAKGKPSGKSKVLALKEAVSNTGNVAQTSSVACSSGSGEIPLPVANYFAFLFSHWAGVRQVWTEI